MVRQTVALQEQISQWIFSLIPALADNQRLATGIFLIGAIILALLLYIVMRSIYHIFIIPLIRRSRNTLDDILANSKVIKRGILLFPLTLLYQIVPHYFDEGSFLNIATSKGLAIILVFITLWTISSFINALHVIYGKLSTSRQRPIKGIVQLINLFMIIGAILWTITILFDISPVAVVGSFGALSAVILLIFRDTILGVTAGIQITANNLLHIGDWIQIPSSNVDGEVIDINLQTIRVRNWDMTIVSVPIYQLISQSFTNWRGMQESHGRRIKRAIYIDMRSVGFCSHDLLKRFEGCALIHDYIIAKRKEIDEDNTRRRLDPVQDAPSSRNITNIGTFRAYIEIYLRAHPRINNDMTLMARQLHPTERGLPIEIYAFCALQEWTAYERTQSDIFDHLLAIMPFFNLRVFQTTSDTAFDAFAKSTNAPSNTPPTDPVLPTS